MKSKVTWRHLTAFVLGAGLVGAGLWVAHPAAGLIWAGAFFLCVAIFGYEK